MPNILINPESGFLEFNTGSASGSAFDTSLSGAARLKFQNSGELNLTSLGTGVADKFTVDGSNGRLLTVNNTVTGSIFSVNDVAGLPIVEVFSDDRVVMGQYASDALVVSGSGVSFAHIPTVSGNPFITGFTEGDTLQTVTDRGSTTTNTIIVNKDGQGAASFNRSSAGTVNVSISASNGDSELTFMNLASEKFTLGNDGTNNSFRIAEGGALGTNDRFVILNGGNVGIGTEGPNALLHVYSAGNGEIEVERNGGALINLQAQTGRGVIGTDNNHPLSLKSNGGVRMTMLTNGDVGIGTTEPLDLLHIFGAVRADLKLEGSYTGGTTDVGKFQFAYGPRGGNVNDRNIASISAYNTTTDSEAGGYLSITTRATSGSMSERIRVNQDGQVDIYGNASFASYLYHKGDEDTNIKFNTDEVVIHAGDVTFFKATETTQNTIKLNSDFEDTDFYLYGNSSTPALFMRGSDREIGINTTNPTASLHVVGSTRIKGSSNDGVLIIENAAGSQSLRIDQNSLRTTTNNNLTLFTSGNLYQLVLHQDGNVGIGTNNPNAMLQIGDGSSEATLFHSYDQYNEVKFYGFSDITDSGVWQFINDGTWDQTRFFIQDANNSSSRLTLHVKGNNGATEILAATSAGKVGIGTASPSETLHVNGKTQLGGRGYTNGGAAMEYASLSETNGGASTILGNAVYAGDSNNTYRKTRSDAGNYIQLNYNKGITFHTNVTGSASSTEYDINNHEQVRITTGGSVGIGTNNPHTNQQLHIYGAGAGLEFSVDAQYANATRILSYNRTAPDAGYKPFFLQSSELRIDTNGSRRMTVDSAGNVGIGTANPAVRLHVTGDGEEIARFESSDNEAYISIKDDTDSIYVGLDPTRDVMSLGFDIPNDSTTNLSIDTAGNVGIGTNDPKTILDIDGAANHGIRLGINNALIGEGGATGTQLLFWNGTSAYYGRSAAPFAHTVSHHFFRAGGNDEMTITTSGVGINKTSPDADLNVDGRVKIEGTTYHSWFNFSTPEDTYIRGGKAGSAVFINDSNNGNVVIGSNASYTVGGTAKLSVKGSSQLLTMGPSTSDLLYFRRHNTVAGRFQIQPYYGGNIGEIQLAPYGDNDTPVVIGGADTNAVAGVKLDVRGNISGSGDFLGTGAGNRITKDGVPYLVSGDAAASLTLQDVTDNGATTTNNIEIQGAGSKSLTVDSTDGHASVVIDRHSTSYDANLSFQTNGATKWRLWNDSNDTTLSIRDEVNASNVMTWEAGGNVGIGLDDPSQKLEVAGDIFINGGAAGGRSLQLKRTGATNPWKLIQGHTQTDYLEILEGSDTRFLIKNGGNVGIGTDSPERELTVSGRARIWNSANTKYIEAFGGNSANFIDSYNNSLYLRYGGDSTKSIVLNSAGNVGLGGVASSKLQVGTGDADDFVKVYYDDGTNLDIHGYGIEFNRVNAYLRATTNADKNLNIGTSTRTWNRLNFYSSDDFLFYNGSTELVRITEAGDVGIGTATPSGTLHVFDTGNVSGDMFIVDGSHGRLFNVSDETTGIIFSVNDAAGLPIVEVDSTSGYDKVSIGEFGTNALVVSGSKVGIGTDNPASPVEVALGGSFNTLNLANLDNGSIGFGNNAGSNKQPTIAGKSNDSIGLHLIGATNNTNTLGDVVFDARENNNSTFADTTKVAFGFSTYSTRLVNILRNGKVGINETSIDAYLHLSNSAEINQKFERPGASAWRIGIPNGQTYFAFDDTNDNLSTPKVVITKTDGFVGIGTTDPTVDLDISGNLGSIRAISTGGGANLYLNSAAGNLTRVRWNSAAGSFAIRDDSNSSDRVTIDSNGHLDVVGNVTAAKFIQDTSVGSEFYAARFGRSNLSESNPDMYGEGDTLILGADSDQPTLVIRDTENVGIGTNSPTSNLHVNGRNLIEGPTVPSTLAISDSGDASKNLRLGYEPTWDVGSISASDLGAGWKNIVIAPHAGKVGIGTTSPHQPLSVKGTIVSYNNSYVQVAGITNSSEAGRFYANNAGGVSKVLIDSNGDSYLNGGDVGIGTATPSSTLHVYDSAGPTIKFERNSNSNLEFTFGTANTSIIGAGELQFRANGGTSNKFVINNSLITASADLYVNANVGIGTNAPSYELDVVGTTRSTYYIGGAYFEENASSSKIKFYPNGTVLVMDEDGELKPCEKENDTLVFGVSKRDFEQPIVLGAEPILVTGPIKVGDYIVTSSKQGHGQAMKEQKLGTIIAQAMENGDGESYNIKAMIRKM